MPAILLMAFGIAHENSKSSHLLRAVHKSTSKRGRRKVGSKLTSKKKILRLNKVIAIAEILIERMKYREYVIDYDRVHHSLEFYLNIKFLEQIKQIKFLYTKNKEKVYHLLATKESIEKLLKKYSFDPSEYMTFNT